MRLEYSESESVHEIVSALCGTEPIASEERYEFVKEMIRTAYHAGICSGLEMAASMLEADAKRCSVSEQLSTLVFVLQYHAGMMRAEAEGDV